MVLQEKFVVSLTVKPVGCVYETVNCVAKICKNLASSDCFMWFLLGRFAHTHRPSVIRRKKLLGPLRPATPTNRKDAEVSANSVTMRRAESAEGPTPTS